jgi:hypothetical protein
MAIHAMDVPAPIRGTPEEERDRHMFLEVEKILEKNPQARVLVYGGSNHTAKIGRVDQRQILGARLCERYGKETVSIKVLSPDDPMWGRMKQERIFVFGKPVVIHLTSSWPDPTRLFRFWGWQVDRSGGVSADAAYDYAVWWPTARKGSRGGK